jgi:hypothetical protein
MLQYTQCREKSVSVPAKPNVLSTWNYVDARSVKGVHGTCISGAIRLSVVGKNAPWIQRCEDRILNKGLHETRSLRHYSRNTARVRNSHTRARGHEHGNDYNTHAIVTYSGLYVTRRHRTWVLLVRKLNSTRQRSKTIGSVDRLWIQRKVN